MYEHLLQGHILAVSFFYITVLAIVSGVTSGILGGGGNVLAVPFMLWIYKYMLHFPEALAMKVTIATSLAVMIFSSLSATIGYAKSNNIAIPLLKQIALPLMIGAAGGAMCVHFVSGAVLERIFGGLLLCTSAYLFWSKYRKRNSGVMSSDHVVISPPKIIMLGISLIVGFTSGLLGVGSGVILMPVLFLLNYRSHLVAGTASACTCIMSTLGTIVFLINGITDHPVDILPYNIGFIYVPALLIMAPVSFAFARVGVALSLKISSETLSKIFMGLLFVLGIRMLMI